MQPLALRFRGLAGGLGTVSGGFLGSRLQTYTVRAPLWISLAGVILAIPMAALVIFVNRPTLYIPALAAAVFLLFSNFGILTAVVVSVAGPRRRAQAVALNIVIIHLLGDVPSPSLMGWVADLWGLKWGVSLSLVALAAGAVLIFTACPILPRIWLPPASCRTESNQRKPISCGGQPRQVSRSYSSPEI